MSTLSSDWSINVNTGFSLDFLKLDSLNGRVSIEGIDNIDAVTDSNVVIVEDVVDTGKMIRGLVATLQQYCPKRVLIACLLRKRCNVESYRPHFIGFQVSI